MSLADFGGHQIGHTDAVKPEARMLTYGVLSPEQLTAIGHYLKGLQ